jgi:hypothetical protein
MRCVSHKHYYLSHVGWRMDDVLLTICKIFTWLDEGSQLVEKFSP